jgi:hypothetical protein
MGSVGTLFFDNNSNLIPAVVANPNKFGNRIPNPAGEGVKKYLLLMEAGQWMGPKAIPAPSIIEVVTRVQTERRAQLLPPGTSLERDYKIKRHAAFHSANGTHISHLLNPTTGEIEELRSQNLPSMSQFLVSQGFTEQTSPPLLTSRSEIRTPAKSSGLPKATIAALNKDHRLFLAGDLDVDTYMASVFYFLESNSSHEDTLGFFTLFGDSLADGTFCSKGIGFHKFLKNSFGDYQQDNATADVQDDVTALEDIEGTNKFAGLKKASMRERLEKAFANLKANVVGADREFYSGDVGVGYKFVLGKVSNQMYDAGECAMDQHDVTNRILWELSKNIHKVRDIYKYLSSAAWKQGGTAFTENLEDRKIHEPLMVEVEDEEEEPEKVDNPGIRGNVVYKRGGKRVFQESRPQFPRVLPAFIQGTDLQMCSYYREGYTYEKIARVMCMTVPAVKLRFARMRTTIAEMKSVGEL